jgi:capsular exopolysaccharide synthesis family protein
MTRLADALERAGAVLGATKPSALASPVSSPTLSSGDGLPVPAGESAAVMPLRPLLAPEAPAALVRAPLAEAPAPSKLRTNPRVVGKLVGTDGLPHACVEQYRKLAATLHHLQAERGFRKLLISSGTAGEGKTLTATNVALTLSESYGRRVLLIDADLRRPTVHQLFDLPNLTGLGDGLRGETDHALPLVRVSPRLTVLTAGRPDPDPMSGLTSERMRRIVDEASRLFDWVLIDTPPVGLLSDGRLLSNMVDGALLVIRAGSTPFSLVTRAIEALGRDRIVGVVLNALPARDLESSGYAAYGYGYYGPPSSSERRGERS